MKCPLRILSMLAGLTILAGFVTPAAAGAAGRIQYVQSSTASTGSRVNSLTLTLRGAVGPGDLLVGWFGQYDTTGQVHVSDNVNGAWSRGGGEYFTNNKGDVALYYKAGAAASAGLTITVSADAPAYLLGTASEYAGVAPGLVYAVAIGRGTGGLAYSGPTGAVQAGDLVYAGLITGGNPTGFSMGSSQGQPYIIRTSNVHGTAGSGDILASAAGTQSASFSLPRATNWYALAATFRPLP